jgi:hypothetical protein
MANDAHREMNARLKQVRRGGGLMDRLRGAAPLGDDRQERLNVQMAAYEDGIRRGDHTAAQIADERIEGLLNEARAERESTVGQPEPAPSFDGGVRRSATRRPPANMNGVFARQHRGTPSNRRRRSQHRLEREE